MKIGVIFFHQNILKIYERRWIDKCIESMVNQTYQPLHFYELNYGDCSAQFVSQAKFFNERMKNHSVGMNFIITKAFEDGCDYVFNTNMDDFYEFIRVECQLEYLEQGYDIVSSDFFEVDVDDKIKAYRHMGASGNIRANLKVNHNVIPHPAVAYNKEFWQDKNNRYGEDDIPKEDLILWNKSIHNGYKFKVIEEPLFFYRRHTNQICK
jgi:hypothetical protein